MKIRLALPEDIEIIMTIYENAKMFMRATGNLNQWNNGYPERELISSDIDSKHLYVVENDNEVCAVFAFIKGPDITYKTIYEGSWPENEDYYVIHRIAVGSQGKGMASYIFDECIKKCDVIRIDTHKDNIPMQRH